MKNTLLALITVFALSSAMVPDTPETKTADYDLCGTTNTTFNAEEKLTYQVFYNWNFVWVKAGYANFSTVETTYAGKPSYKLKAVGKTQGSYDPIYKVRDYYTSYVDKETLKPLKFIRDTNEGGYTTYEELRFNHSSGKVASKKGKTKETVKAKEFNIDQCAHDLVSILYYMRNIDFENYTKGDKIPVNVFFGEKEYDLYVKYLGIETKRVKGQGKFKCHKLSPLLVKGDIFTETDKMTVWVTADDNKVPVLIESPIKVGSVKAVIRKTENLKYPVKAKL